MKYTNKQIKRILRVQELVEMANTLSRVYVDFNDKEFIIDTITDKSRIYKMYCSSIYNLILAIQGTKENFAHAKRYGEFEEMLEQNFTANDNKYYSKEDYQATFFKIIETIRHQVNHYTRDDEDNNLLFEVYIDFDIIENLRLVINDIFYEIYNELDKNRVKNIILSKTKIRYSVENLNNKFAEFKSKMNNSSNNMNRELKKYSDRSIEVFAEFINPKNLYELCLRDNNIIEKLDKSTKEVQEIWENVEKYVNQNGTDLEKETITKLEDFVSQKDNLSINELKGRFKRLEIELEELLKKSKQKD